MKYKCIVATEQLLFSMFKISISNKTKGSQRETLRSEQKVLWSFKGCLPKKKKKHGRFGKSIKYLAVFWKCQVVRFSSKISKGSKRPLKAFKENHRNSTNVKRSVGNLRDLRKL